MLSVCAQVVANTYRCSSRFKAAGERTRELATAPKNIRPWMETFENTLALVTR